MSIDTYKQYVVVDTLENKIVGAGTLVMEKKFLRECGVAGHIEDVVVSQACRGQSLGKLIVKSLVEEGKRMGCYKVILDCSEKNVSFYERCGFTRKEVQMALYF